MELNALKGKIEHLERLVASQSREIESLKRIVMQRPSSAHINGYKKPYINTYDNQHRNHHHEHQHDTNFNHHQHQSLSASPQPHQQRQSMIYQPYVMDSHIHPDSAIPPIARAFTVGPDNKIRYKGELNSALDLSNNFNKFGPNERLRYKSDYTNSLTGDAHFWSDTALDRKREVGSVAAIDDSDGTDEDTSSSEQATGRKVPGRQVLIEVLTCFCPCFSMC